MSVADRGAVGPRLPAPWERLERAAQDAAVVVATWKRRAAEAEEEVTRLRENLEELADSGEAADDVREELRRLRAENAALHSRLAQARKRIGALLKRMDTLGPDT